MQVGSLKQQHLIDTCTAYAIRNLLNLSIRLIGPAECGANQLLTEALQEIICLLMSTRRDLDELCEAIADLGNRECAEECEVEEGVGGCVVGT